MDLLQFLQLVTILFSSSVLTGLISHFLNRRKNRIDIDDKVNEMYSRLADSQREEIDALNGHILVLQKQYKAVKAENVILREEIRQLKDCNDSYRQQAKRRKDENSVLRDEFESLRGLGET